MYLLTYTHIYIYIHIYHIQVYIFTLELHIQDLHTIIHIIKYIVNNIFRFIYKHLHTFSCVWNYIYTNLETSIQPLNPSSLVQVLDGSPHVFTHICVTLRYHICKIWIRKINTSLICQYSLNLSRKLFPSYASLSSYSVPYVCVCVCVCVYIFLC